MPTVTVVPYHEGYVGKTTSGVYGLPAHFPNNIGANAYTGSPTGRLDLPGPGSDDAADYAQVASNETYQDGIDTTLRTLPVGVINKITYDLTYTAQYPFYARVEPLLMLHSADWTQRFVVGSGSRAANPWAPLPGDGGGSTYAVRLTSDDGEGTFMAQNPNLTLFGAADFVNAPGDTRAVRIFSLRMTVDYTEVTGLRGTMGASKRQFLPA